MRISFLGWETKGNDVLYWYWYHLKTIHIDTHIFLFRALLYINCLSVQFLQLIYKKINLRNCFRHLNCDFTNRKYNMFPVCFYIFQLWVAPLFPFQCIMRHQCALSEIYCSSLYTACCVDSHEYLNDAVSFTSFRGSPVLHQPYEV